MTEHTPQNPRSADHRANRLWTGAALLGAALWMTGCAQRENVTGFDPVVENPPPDSTAPIRQFAPSAAVYENTATVAWSTRMPFVDPDGIKDPARPIVEPVIFLTNVVVMPISLIMDPPFKNQYAYRTGGVGNTMDAVPPLTDVVVETEGAIVPALKPRVDSGEPIAEPQRFKAGVPIATERRLKQKAQQQPGASTGAGVVENDDEWTELVPVRTSKGIVLMTPEEVLTQAASPSTQPATPPPGSPPATGAVPSVPAVVVEAGPSTQPSNK